MPDILDLLNWAGFVGILLELLSLCFLYYKHIHKTRFVVFVVWFIGVGLSVASGWFSFMLEEDVMVIGVPFMWAAFERGLDGKWLDFIGHTERVLWNYLFWLLLPQLVYGTGRQTYLFLNRSYSQFTKPTEKPSDNSLSGPLESGMSAKPIDKFDERSSL